MAHVGQRTHFTENVPPAEGVHPRCAVTASPALYDHSDLITRLSGAPNDKNSNRFSLLWQNPDH